MGIIIAITISKPVELRMFQQEIEVELNSRRIEEVKKKKNSITTLYEGDMEIVQEEIIRLREDIDKYEKIRKEKRMIIKMKFQEKEVWLEEVSDL